MLQALPQKIQIGAGQRAAFRAIPKYPKFEIAQQAAGINPARILERALEK